MRVYNVSLDLFRRDMVEQLINKCMVEVMLNNDQLR